MKGSGMMSDDGSYWSLSFLFLCLQFPFLFLLDSQLHANDTTQRNDNTLAQQNPKRVVKYLAYDNPSYG